MQELLQVFLKPGACMTNKDADCRRDSRQGLAVLFGQ
jgi:hypothetical protein